MTAVDYYAVLGIAPGSTEDEIRHAFLERAQAYHPDNPGGGDRERMIEACQAVDILTDQGKRALYDRYRANPSDAATLRAWESALADSNVRAQAYAAHPTDLKSWLQGASAEVQSTRRGRILAGLAAGTAFGAALAAIIGHFMALHPGICAAIGAGVGACAGAFGAASNE